MISRAENEVDSLEIVVETEANRASRTLTSVEKKALKVADALDKCAKSAHGLDFTGIAGLSELIDVKNTFKDILKEQKAISNSELRFRTNRSDLKYPAKELKALQSQFKNAKLEMDFKGLDKSELTKSISNFERGYGRIKQQIADTINLGGTDVVGGKAWYKSIMQMNQYENAIKDAKSALDQIQSKANPTINGEPFKEVEDGVKEASEAVKDLEDEISSVDSKSDFSKTLSSFDTLKNKASEIKKSLTRGGFGNYTKNFLDMLKMPETPKVNSTNSEIPTVKDDGTYDTEGIQEYVDSFGSATNAAQTFEAEIKRLKQELSGLEKKGLGQGDKEYDKIAKQLAIVTARRNEYNKSLKQQAKDIVSKEQVSNISKLASAFSKAATGAGKFKKAIGEISMNGLKGIYKTVHGLTKPFDTARGTISKVGRAIGTLRKQSNKGMYWGRMIGSSILFSTVFGMISQIKNAIKEGTNNLVQYSADYNNSISGMVSSLLYLKNAWTVAFAPIINVVGPYISAFIDMLAGAMNKVGQLMSALTGKSYAVQAKKVWKDYASGLDTTKKNAKDAGKAVKDLANYTLGIDELNVIQPNADNGSGSSGSGGGSGVSGPSATDMFKTTSVDGVVSDFAEKLKKAWKDADFTEIGTIIGEKFKNALNSIPWDSIQEVAFKVGKSFATLINGFVEVDGLGETIGQTIGQAINTGIVNINAFLDYTKWDEVGTFIGNGVNGIVDSVKWEDLGHLFAQKWNAIFSTIGEAARTFKWAEFGKDLASSVNTWISDFDWAGNGARLGDLAKGMLDTIIQFLENTDWKELGNGIAKFVESIDWTGIVAKLAEGLGAAIGGLAALLWGMIEDAWDSVVKWWKDVAYEDGQFTMEGLLNGILNVFSNIGSWIKSNVFDPFIDGFKSIFGIHSPSTVMAEMGNYLILGLANGVLDTIGTAIQAFENVWAGIQEVFSPVTTWFSDKFTSAKNAIVSAFKFIGSWANEKWADIKRPFSNVRDWFKDGFQKAYDAVKSIWSGLGQFFKGIAENAFKPIKSLVNGVIKGVNWVLDKVGSTGNLSEWAGVHFANGTDGLAKNTLGIVNDQPGSVYKELIMPPTGRAFIPEGRNVMLPLQKGTKIMPAEQTKALMGNKPHFARGIGDFFGDAWSAVKKFTGNVMDYIQDPESIVKIAIDKFTDVSGMFEPWTRIGKGMIDKTFDAILNKIKSVFSVLIPKVDYKASAGVEQWRGLAKKALELTNQFSESNLNALLTQMQHESGGNPNAINNWDVNAKRGTPSKGLMQVIDPTFHANAMAGYNTNIYDPLSNMIAAINYTVKRYGSLYNGWTARGYKGYENGGIPKSGEIYVANEHGFGSEYIGNIGNQHVVANNNQIISGISAGVEHANDETNMLLREVIANQKALLKKEVSVNMDSKRVDKQISRARSNTGFSFSPA